MIIATCGHEVDGDRIYDVALKGYTLEDERCIDYVTLCDKCYTMYKTDEQVLYNSYEESRWLKTT